MSPAFSKGLLKGAALACAGAASLGAGSAQAFSCNLNSLGSCGGTIGNFTVSSVALSGGAIGNMAGTVDFALNTPTELYIDFTKTSTAATTGLANTGIFSFNLSATTGFLKSYTAAYTNTGTNIGTFDFNGPGIISAPANIAGGTIASDFPIAPSSPVAGGSFSFDWSKTSGTGRLTGPSLFITSDVPVPLPIVGAGLAFGFTRKLRKRAKSLG